MIQRMIFALSLSATVALDLRAQVPAGTTHSNSLADVQYTLGSGPFQRIEVVKACAPKHYRDAIVLRDGTLGRIAAFGVWNKVMPLGFPGQASDFAVLEGGSPSVFDKVLVTDPASGNATVVSWIDQQTPTMSASPLPQFLGASKLTAAKTRFGHDVAGVAPDGMTVVRAAIVGNSATYVSAYNVGSPVQSMALGDLDGDAVLELFCVVNEGVLVMTRLGAPITLLPSAHPGGFVSSLGTRVLFLARNSSNTGWSLRFIAGGGPITGSNAVTLNGGDFNPIGMRATNADRQGELDVVITQKTTKQLLVVRLFTTSPPNLTVECETVAMSANPLSTGSAIQCSAAVADLDGDLYSDYGLIMDEAGEIVIARGTAAGRSYTNNTMSLLYEETLYQNTGAPHVNGLRLRLNNIPELFTGNFTTVNVNLWAQDGAGTLVNGVGLLNETYEIVSGAGFAQELFLPSWDTPHNPNAYHHLEVVFQGSDDGETGPLFTIAGYSHVNTESVAANNYAYLNSQDQMLLDLTYDGSGPSRIYYQPGTENRILLGGHVRSARIPPSSPFPTPAPPTSQQPSTTPIF